MLEHRVDVALVGRHALDEVARDADEALVGLLEPGEHAQRGRLAAPARTEQRQELTGFHFEVDVVHRDGPAEPLGDVDDLDRTRFVAHGVDTVNAAWTNT